MDINTEMYYFIYFFLRNTVITLLNIWAVVMADTYISSCCSLGNGVNSKQTRVRVTCIESTDLLQKNYNLCVDSCS